MNSNALLIAQLKETAELAASAAGELLRQDWHEPRQIRTKGFRDLVTDSDIAVQKTITDIIQARFPEHGFLTEEIDNTLPTDGDIVWIVDPIDGTSNFSRYIPDVCVSIAAALSTRPVSVTNARLEPVVGVIHDPIRRESFSGAVGQGAWLNGSLLTVSKTTDLAHAILAFDWSRQPEKRQKLMKVLGMISEQVHTVRAFGSAALGLAYVAAGRLDLYFNLGVGAWDVSAALVLIREAGGAVSNLSGVPWTLNDAGCVAGNATLPSVFHAHAQLPE
jgi:myo-inositol-1(or 4)-monophosphatase